ncbi:MAG TPA: uroporphyrinogen-III synthase [Planctomycetes bacterium]|nr:uroporphyrinogen-III synthase [Planctomycetota bacterium]
MGTVMPGENLSGSRWILTRPRIRSDSWHEALTARGADVFLAPALELIEGERDSVRFPLLNLGRDGLLVFTSATTVVHFFSLLEQEDYRQLDSMRWAAVGSATADAVRARGYEVDVEGDGTGADQLVQQVISVVKPCESIHFTSDSGLPTIVDQLSEAGFSVIRAEATRTQVEPGLDPMKWDLEVQGARSGVIFSSPASVRAVLSRSGNVRESLFAIPTVAAGVTTAQELQAQGWQNVEIAQRSTPADIVVACEKLLAGGTMGPTG